MSRFEKGHIPWIKGKKGFFSKEKSPTWRGGKPKCIDCEKELVSYKAKRCKTCSIKTRIGKCSTSWKGGKPKCIDCSKQLSSYKPKRCKTCAGKLRVGINNAKWNGGITAQNRIERTKFRQTIQKQVFERDNYTCQMCGNKKDLQVDHIQSWKDYVELRFSMDNCRTLCMKCHYKITYGREMTKNVKTWGNNFFQIERMVS